MRVPTRLRPTARSLVAALLAVSAAAGCNCDPKTRAVSASIAVTPVEIDFGNIAVGTTTDALVEVRNTGNGGLDVQAPDLAGVPAAFHLQDVYKVDCQGGPRATDPSGSTTLAGEECTRFRVRFTPTALGEVEGDVVVASSDAENPKVKVHVKGAGVASSLRVCVLDADGTEPADGSTCSQLGANPPVIPTVDFGSQPITATVTRTVRVHNDGEGSLVVSDLSTESDFPDFKLSADAKKGTVDPAKYLDVPVVFAPTGDGDETGKLVITSNDTKNSPLDVPLTGKAEGPELCIQPSTGLDFGSIPVGTSRTLSLNLKNCGFVDYNIKTLSFSENGGSSSFALDQTSVPGVPHDLPPGAEVNVNLAFSPSSVATFTGQFHIATDYQQGNIPVTGTGAPAACGGTTRPTAKIVVKKGSTVLPSVDPTVQPLDTVTFDASTSVVPRGGAIYKWLLKSAPPSNTDYLSSTNTTRTSLYAEFDGDYVVELVVGDQFGCDSAPQDVTLHVKSNAKLHVQLTWAQSYGDVDLHFVGPGGTFDDGLGNGGLWGPTDASDCYWYTCKSGVNDIVDWGLNGTTRADGTHGDDPTLDIDQLWGNGPENVTDESPFPATYSVQVHYYCSRQGLSGPSFGPADAKVSIFVNGQSQLTVTKRITQRDIWTVASVTVSPGGAITVTPVGSVVKSGNDYDACTSDTN